MKRQFFSDGSRRLVIWLLTIIFLFIVTDTASPREKKFKPRLSIKLTGGIGYLFVGDINTHLKSYDNYLSHMTPYEGGEMKRLHFGTDLGGELRLDVSPKFALSIGTGYISGKNKSYFEYRGPFPFHMPLDNTQHYTLVPEIKAIPLELGIYYTRAFQSRINLLFTAGIGYYFSKASLYKLHWSSAYGSILVIYTKEEKYNLSSNIFGLYGGIGFEYNIASNLALVLEVQGRYAQANPKGTRISSVWELPWEEEEGSFYIGERNSEDYGRYCPDLIISPSKPTGDEFQYVKKAVLDLSGIAFRVGIRIKLF